jgi:hypothetical protein
MYKRILFVLMGLVTVVTLNAQQVKLSLQSSSNECKLKSKCNSGLICFDIVMSVDQNKNLDSYNIWLSYDQTVLSLTKGGKDASCLISDGKDTNIESTFGYYRVTGIPKIAVPFVANQPRVVHTVCFKVVDFGPKGYSNCEGTVVSVGGIKFNGALATTVTFADGIFDDDVAESFFTVSSASVPCLTAKGHGDIQEEDEVVALEARTKNSVFFSVDQNEPNPWQSNTMIRYNLPVAGDVKVTMFDLTGKIITELKAKGEKGNNEMTVTRDHLRGYSGLILYQVESGVHVLQKRMFLIE